MSGTTLLTDDIINRLPPATREILLRDSLCDGLGLRVQPGGSRSWVFWERHEGRSRRVTLGAYPALDLAAARAMFMNRKAGCSIVPVPVKSILFRDLAKSCVAARRVTCKSSTMASFETYLDTQLLPAFGDLTLDRMTPALVARWFHTYSRTSPGGANMALAAFTTVINWGHANGHIPKALPNPGAPIRKNRRPPRGRMLSSAQLLALRRAIKLQQGTNPNVALIHLLLLTGCRYGEIAGLTWDEVKPDRLSLIDAKTGPRDVFLSRQASVILEHLKSGQTESPFVFPSRISRSGHVSSVDTIWARLRKTAGLPKDIRLHDLRHTFASHALLAGESLPTTGRLLGHASPRTTQRYAHLDGETLAKAADEVASEVARLMSDRSG